MFNKLKKAVGDVVESATDLVGIDRIQDLLSSRFSDLVSSVYDERSKDNNNSNLSTENLNDVVNGYVIKNVAAASASSLIPGPAGILASVPSLIVNVGNQMRCAYDISCAYDKETFINKDALLDIPLQSMGISSGLAELQNAQNLIDSPTEVLSEKAKGLGKVLVLNKLKNSMTSMIPGMNTVVAIIQAKMETANVASTSMTFFDPNKILVDPVIEESITEVQRQHERIKALVNLMTLDSKASPQEEQFVLPIIKNSLLEEELKEEFIAALKTPITDFVVNYELILNSGDGENLVVDLAVLTKRDGIIGPRELQYVKFAAQKLKIDTLVYKQVLA